MRVQEEDMGVEEEFVRRRPPHANKGSQSIWDTRLHILWPNTIAVTLHTNIYRTTMLSKTFMLQVSKSNSKVTHQRYSSFAHTYYIVKK